MPRNPLVAAMASLERAQLVHLRAAEAAQAARMKRSRAVLLALEHGASYREVGRVLGISGASVYGMAERARREKGGS